ncbi:hypothetical protein [Streptomyces noursei]|uniref:hypothetical protein n=1 Tax=Streptomyces noursei TaxID=1971 RepID=UPI0011AF2FD4|nr:hypothetical protein [Streptomyces noursei]
MLGILTEFEQARHAEITAAGGNPDDDRDRLEYVRAIAKQYQHHHREAAELPVLIQSLAEDLDLNDVRALRVAGETAVALTPEVIMRAADRGMKAPEIAGKLALRPHAYMTSFARSGRSGTRPAPSSSPEPARARSGDLTAVRARLATMGATPTMANTNPTEQPVNPKETTGPSCEEGPVAALTRPSEDHPSPFLSSQITTQMKGQRDRKAQLIRSVDAAARSRLPRFPNTRQPPYWVTR